MIMISKEIFSHLKCTDAEIIYRECIDSTSSYARKLLNKYDEKRYIVIADGQTCGRGRNGKSFYSSNKGSVYMSVVLHPGLPFTDTVGVTTAAAVAVSRAVEHVTGKQTDIKWVNDLYYEGKKVCGILCEAVSQKAIVSSVIIGVGINLGYCVFPDELDGVAGSLGCNVNLRYELIAAVADELFSLNFGALDEKILAEYRSKSMVIGKDIYYYTNGEKNNARAVGIDGQGGLIIENADGTSDVLRSGEITLRLSD